MMRPTPFLRVLLGVAFACGLSACSAVRLLPVPPRRALPADLDARVRTHLDADMFPASWGERGMRPRATPLAPGEEARARRVLAGAMAMYPVDLLRENLERLYVVGGLSFAGVRAGGTNSRRRLYLVDRGEAAGYSDRALERLFHAEFSSILLRRHRDLLDEAAWARGNIRGFRYGASGRSAIRHGLADLNPDPWTLKQGFLYEYGMSSAENDFNSIASWLFVRGRELDGFARAYVGIAHKRRLTLAFYGALDERFTPAFFASLAAASGGDADPR